MKDYLSKYKSVLIFYVSFAVIIGTVISYFFNGYLNGNSLNTEKLGHFGDFVGGLLGAFLTIIATIYIINTYEKQKEELESQKEELLLNRKLISQQQFENTFFNLLKVHSDLKNNISFNFYQKSITKNNSRMINPLEQNVFGYTHTPILKGKDFFEYAHYDFSNLWRYENGLLNLGFTVDEDIKQKHIDYPYNTFFEESKKTIQHLKDTKFKYDLFFEYYANYLGDYFRNIYHILKFISDEKQKAKRLDKNMHEIETDLYFKNYADILQSQLSFSELFLIYYNSLKFKKPRKLIKEFNFLENLHSSNLINDFHKNIKCLGAIKNK